MVKKIDTDSRCDIGQDTICLAQLQTEHSQTTVVFSFSLRRTPVLKSARSATWQYVKAHPSHE